VTEKQDRRGTHLKSPDRKQRGAPSWKLSEARRAGKVAQDLGLPIKEIEVESSPDRTRIIVRTGEVDDNAIETPEDLRKLI